MPNLSPNLFFLIGPPRSGSSLMARCIDDHPQAICLCESEANRAMFPPFALKLHMNRMRLHGATPRDVIRLLHGKRQCSVDDLTQWYRDAAELLLPIHEKTDAIWIGDKSPAFGQEPELVNQFQKGYPTIYTIRDPRAIFASIEVQEATQKVKQSRWQRLIDNYLTWRPFLENSNLLIVPYEDLVSSPATTMHSVYAHLGLNYEDRFLKPFERKFPRRFLWDTAIDYETGFARDFDTSRIDRWKQTLSDSQLQEIRNRPEIVEMMERFQYSW